MKARLIEAVMLITTGWIAGVGSAASAWLVDRWIKRKHRRKFLLMGQPVEPDVEGD